MVAITFGQSDGAELTVEIEPGVSLMAGAKQRGVPGIDADCGGSMACGTCHVRVDPSWREKLPAMSEAEQDTLVFAVEADERSRLSCQVPVSERLEGLVVHVPETQR